MGPQAATTLPQQGPQGERKTLSISLPHLHFLFLCFLPSCGASCSIQSFFALHELIVCFCCVVAGVLVHLGLLERRGGEGGGEGRGGEGRKDVASSTVLPNMGTFLSNV